MRAVVISDSHGDSASVNMIISRHRSADIFVFLGDGENDFLQSRNCRLMENKTVIAVKGNNDYYSQLPLEDYFFMNDKKIYALHGHTKGVKYSSASLEQEAEKIGASVVVYGHTHNQRVDYARGIYYMCPGAAMHGEYGIIDLDEKTNSVLCYTTTLRSD